MVTPVERMGEEDAQEEAEIAPLDLKLSSEEKGLRLLQLYEQGDFMEVEARRQEKKIQEEMVATSNDTSQEHMKDDETSQKLSLMGPQIITTKEMLDIKNGNCSKPLKKRKINIVPELEAMD